MNDHAELMYNLRSPLNGCCYGGECAAAIEALVRERDEAHQKYVDANEARIDAERELSEARAALANPPKHKFWGVGEPDCPRELKAGNGELHTLRCKVCGISDPKNDICLAALPNGGRDE